MPLYVADYLADTAHLTALENGAYLLLIMNYWQRGRALPSDSGQLARICRLSEKQFSKIIPQLEIFFEVVGNTWVHHRIEAELAKVRDKSTKASNAGKASAQHKANVRSTSVQQTLNHTDTDTDTDTEEDRSEATKPDLKPAIEAWNLLASEKNLPKVQRLTDARKVHLTARLGDCGGLEGWHMAMAKIRGSPFLTGENKSGWRADFDFVLQQSSFTKLMEGKYDGTTQRETSSPLDSAIESVRSSIDRRIAEASQAERCE